MAAIQITLGDENRIYIEKDVLQSQLFAEQYAQLIKKITEYVHAEKEEGVSISRNYNNLFLINGERGAGKSSMLASMHGYLGSTESPEQKKFLRLDVIDPSSFTNNANILQIIIAELFKNFKDETAGKITYEEKNEITKIFVQIKHSLCVLDSPKAISAMDDSDIESLQDMSNAIVLEQLIGELISKILKARKEDMLLVCIDDIDLNTAHAYEMLEQVRKYLILPNVLVLIAAKMNQLQEVVQQHFLSDYKELVKNSVLDTQDALEMSNKYLLKLLPLEHRVDLNTAIQKFKQSIEIVRGEETIVTASSGDELIYKLIYQKTGLQYLLESNGVNYIVPNNLRAFRFLVKMLCDMEGEEYRNIESYQQYFLFEWVPQNLPVDEQHDIEELLNDSDVSKVNKRIVQNIANQLENVGFPPYIETITDQANVYSNISLGDVMAVIIWSKSINSSEKFARYIYAIKHAYTILLEKAGHEMLQDESIQKKIDMYEDSNAEEYINSYQRLVGGSLLSGYTWDYLLPLFNNTENRLHRKISLINQSVPHIPALIKYLVVVPYRPKTVNEGEGYRKQVPTYYMQSITKTTDQVIIDWFNILYAIPFFIEQVERYSESEIRQEMIEAIQEATQLEKLSCKIFFEMAITSIDLLERIYWHIRSRRNYLRTTSNKLDIYTRFLKALGEVSVDSYIDDVADVTRLNRIVIMASTILAKEKERDSIVRILEEIQMGPTRPFGYPEKDTIRKIHTVSELRERMVRINEWKGYSRAWIEAEFDKIGFTDEEINKLEPLTIRNRLKRIKYIR